VFAGDPEEIFGSRTWTHLRRAARTKVNRKWRRIAAERPHLIEEAVDYAIDGAYHLWLLWPSSVRKDDPEGNYRRAVQWTYWEACRWLGATLEADRDELAAWRLSLNDDHPPTEVSALLGSLLGSMALLDPEQQLILRRHYFEGHSLHRIGMDLSKDMDRAGRERVKKQVQRSQTKALGRLEWLLALSEPEAVTAYEGRLRWLRKPRRRSHRPAT